MLAAVLQQTLFNISECLNLKQQSDLARDFNWIYFVQRARQTDHIAP